VDGNKIKAIATRYGGTNQGETTEATTQQVAAIKPSKAGTFTNATPFERVRGIVATKPSPRLSEGFGSGRGFGSFRTRGPLRSVEASSPQVERKTQTERRRSLGLRGKLSDALPTSHRFRNPFWAVEACRAPPITDNRHDRAAEAAMSLFPPWERLILNATLGVPIMPDRPEATVPPALEAEATGRVQAIFDDIKATKSLDFVPRFWRVLATNPDNLDRVWTQLKSTMHPQRPTQLTPLIREIIALAVSGTNGCPYCIQSHTAAVRKLGLDASGVGEVLSVVALFNATNALAHGDQIEPDVFPPQG